MVAVVASSLPGAKSFGARDGQGTGQAGCCWGPLTRQDQAQPVPKKPAQLEHEGLCRTKSFRCCWLGLGSVLLAGVTAVGSPAPGETPITHGLFCSLFFFFFSPLASSVQSHCSPRVSCPLQIPFPSKHKAKAIQPHVGTPSVRPRAGGGGAPRCHPRLHPPAGLVPPQQLLASGDLALPRQQLPARQLRAVVGRGGVCSCHPREELGGSVRRAAR